MFSHFFSPIAKAVVSIGLAISSFFGGHPMTPAPDPVALGSLQPAADFRSSLVSGITAAATTMTLVSTSTPSGEVLLQGKQYGFKLGGQEYVIGTLSSGKQITSMTRGVSLITGTTTGGIAQAWGRGTAVEITDAPILLEISNKVSGIQNFDNLLHYDSSVATSSLSNGDIPDKAWVLNQTQAVTSVSNADGTLTVSPTTGVVVGSIALSHANVWTAASTTFVNGVTIGTATTTSATSTNFFTTTASTTNLSVGANALIGGKLGISTTTPTDGLTVANNNSILVSENKVATSTSQTIDWTKGNQQLMQIGTNAITVTQTNYLAGQHELVIVCNPASGTAGAITWSGVEWSGSSVPTQTTGANLCDAWSFIATQATSTTGTLKLFGAASVNIN